MRIAVRIGLWLLAGLAGLAVLLVAGGLGYRAWRQHEVAQTQRIATPRGIVEQGFVTVNGAREWVQIRGEDRDNPVVLVLSGGPGASMIPIAYDVFRPWEKNFTVVQWDQRGAGKTYIADGGDKSPGVTLPQMTADTIVLTDYVRQRLHKDRVILLGWSWGSLLGLEALHQRPELYSVYVGTGQMVNGKDNETVGYDALLARASAAHDVKAVDKLKALGRPPYASPKSMEAERDILGDYVPPADGDVMSSLPLKVLSAPGYSLPDIYALGGKAPAFSEARLWSAIMGFDARHLGTRFDTPMIFIEGADDIQVPTTLARAYFDEIQAPKKAFVAIPGTGHFALLSRPAAFLDTMLSQVRPLAMGR